MRKKALIAALMLCVSFFCSACTDNRGSNDPAGDSQHVSQETYEKLPDETIYGNQGQVLATGKDLIPMDKVDAD